MVEIEVKILEVNVRELLKKLKKMGAKKVFDGEMAAYYYDYPGRSLYKEGSILRLRLKGKKWELTYKESLGPKMGKQAKMMNEFEVNLPPGVNMGKVMEGVGLKVYKKFRKHRQSFSLAKVHFEIDTYPGIPPFVEVEATDLATLKKYVQKLGYTMSQAKPWSTYELFRHYGKK